jgi:TRAP-type C4-dicarboxylate transport system permease small subunit
MEKILTGLVARLLRIIAFIEDSLLIGLLALMILLAAAQILMRNFLGTGFAGSDQLLRLLVLWVGLLGAVAASRDDKQINIDMLSRFLPAVARRATRLVLDLFTAGVAALLAYHSGRFVQTEYAAGTSAFVNVPAWIAELILPLAFGLIALRYLLMFASHLRHYLCGAKTA